MNPTVVDKFSGLAGLVERVGQVPNINKWLNNRPAGVNPMANS